MASRTTKAARNNTTFTDELAEVMGEVGYVQKDGTNSFHKYKYASAEAVLQKVNKALSSRGICIESQAELLRYDVDVSGPKPVSKAVVLIRLAFRKGGETCIATGIGEGSDKTDKAVMKANTAAVKYALANAFLISWGDDPEADASVDQDVAKKAPKKPRKKAATSEENKAGALLATIAAAQSEEELTKADIKPAIRALREGSTEDYESVRDAYTARMEEFKKESK